MNSLKLALENFEKLISESVALDLSFSDKAGLYAATKQLEREIEAVIEEEVGGDGYALEKLGNAVWHIGAALGFDITNGRDASFHHVQALGQFGTLRDVLQKALPDRE